MNELPEVLTGSWGRAVLAGDLSAVDPRHHLELLRDLAQAAVAADRSLVALFQALGSSDPIALADLAVGPRAPRGARLVEAALAVLPALEQQVSAGALYRRLAVLAGPGAERVLACAAQRHPAAGWLVALSTRSGEPEPGLAHLRAAAGHPAFAQVCWDHAAAGHHAALVSAAGLTGRAEPAAALLAHGAVELARAATAALVERHPEASVPPPGGGVGARALGGCGGGGAPWARGPAARQRLASMLE